MHFYVLETFMIFHHGAHTIKDAISNAFCFSPFEQTPYGLCFQALFFQDDCVHFVLPQAE